jgi:hypothetical protein
MCGLHISGKNLDPAVAAGFKPYRHHRIGEPRRPSRPDGPKWETSGFSVAVSDAPWSELKGQLIDACAFLDQYSSEIRALRDSGTVEDMRLDFPVDLRVGDGVAAQFELFPPDLVAKAGALGLGIEISLYPADDEGKQGPAMPANQALQTDEHFGRYAPSAVHR